MKTEIIIRNNQIIQRSYAENEIVLSKKKLLSQLSEGMIRLENYVDDSVVTILDQGRELYYTVFKIPAIQLTANWVPKFDKENDLILKMAMEETKETIFLSPIIIPPSWMNIFGCIEQRYSGEVKRLRAFMKIKDQESLKQLPLPNIYEDGEICTGDKFIERMNETNISEKMEIFNSILSDNPWNKDLWKDTIQYLTFKENTKYPGGYELINDNNFQDAIYSYAKDLGGINLSPFLKC